MTVNWIKQLLSYTTWHDSKLAIVFFSKTNKDFFKVIETIEDNLKLLPKFKSLTDINKNEIELFLSSDNQGQLLKIRICLFWFKVCKTKLITLSSVEETTFSLPIMQAIR